MEYGLQMYSVRDITENNLEDAVRQVAEIGYKFIEFAGFMGCSAEKINRILCRNNVRVCGAHAPVNDLLNAYEDTIAFHKAIGNRYYIIPGHDMSTRTKLEEFIDNVNRLQPLLDREGIILCYHNHDNEFKPNKDGQIVYDELVKRTNIGLEIDTYWVYVAGKNPVEMMKNLRDRVCLIHIKDGHADGRNEPLGYGTAPVKAVYEKARSMNIPMVVESESLNPDGITEVRICFKYLKNLE